jgi:hypothetical protein
MSWLDSKEQPGRILLRTCQPFDLQREDTNPSSPGLDLSQGPAAPGTSGLEASPLRQTGTPWAGPAAAWIQALGERSLWDERWVVGRVRGFDWMML